MQGRRAMPAIAVLALLTSACTDSATSGPGGSLTSATSQVTAPVASTPRSSAARTTPTSAVTTPVGTTPVPSATSSARAPCSPQPTVRIQAGQSPPPMCVVVGQAIRFTADASPRQPWGPIVSSDARVLSCTSHRQVEGSVGGTCIARQRGTATVSTMTSNFPGDPHGPPIYLWSARVTVS